MEEKKEIDSKLYKATVYLFRNRPRNMKTEEIAKELGISDAFIKNLASTGHIPSVVNVEKLFNFLGGKFELVEQYIALSEKE